MILNKVSNLLIYLYYNQMNKPIHNKNLNNNNLSRNNTCLEEMYLTLNPTHKLTKQKFSKLASSNQKENIQRSPP